MLNQEQQVFEQIKKSNTILVTFSRSSSGDAVASALAMYLFLKKIGKKVDISAEADEQNTSLKFLPSSSDISSKLDNLRKFIISLDIRHTKVGQIQYKVETESLDFIVAPLDGFFTKDDISTRSSGFKYDLIITIATRDLESLGKVYDQDTEFFYQTTIINIDHQAANESYGQVNHIDLNAVATGEVLFTLFSNYERSLIDDDIATCLLTSIIISTKSFKTSNISPAALSTASQLIAMGARREEIVNNLYRSRSLNLLKLWGIVLARLSSTEDNKVIWSMIYNDDFEKTKSKVEDLREVIDELIINIPQSKIILLGYEVATENKKTTEVMIHGVKNLDVSMLLESFKPVGTKSLIKINSEKPIKEFIKEISDVVVAKMARLEI